MIRHCKPRTVFHVYASPPIPLLGLGLVVDHGSPSQVQMQSLDLSQHSFFRAAANQWHLRWSLSDITLIVIISYIYNFSWPSSFPVGMLKILNLAYINRVKKLLNSQWWRFSGLPDINIFTQFKQQILRDFFFFLAVLDPCCYVGFSLVTVNGG